MNANPSVGRANRAIPRGWFAYAAGGLILLAAYVATSTALYATRELDDGPLSAHRADLVAPLAGSIPLDQALHICFPKEHPQTYRYRVVGGTVGGRPYYGCYELHSDGSINRAAVIDGQGVRTLNAHILEVGGAWPWLGSVTSPWPVIAGGAGIASLIGLGFVYYRKLRPGPPVRRAPWWAGGPAVVLYAVVPVIGWVALAVVPGISSRRRKRGFLLALFIGIAFWANVGALGGDAQDALSAVIVGFVTAAAIYTVVAGRHWVAPPGFGAPEDLLNSDGRAPAAWQPPKRAVPAADAAPAGRADDSPERAGYL